MTTEETITLKAYSKEDKNSDARGGRKGDHDEEEDDDPRMGGGQRVQCNQ